MFGPKFIPHAGLSSHHVGIGYLGIVLVHFPPGLIHSVVDSIEIVESNIKVDLIVVGQDDWILPS